MSIFSHRMLRNAINYYNYKYSQKIAQRDYHDQSLFLKSVLNSDNRSLNSIIELTFEPKPKPL